MMPIKNNDSIFNPEEQITDLSSKITAGLERISESFRILLWNHAKTLGLSPIQIQILIFLNFHKSSIRQVSHLAKEFNLTKPTISDAIKALHEKKLIKKHASDTDKRAYSISLTAKGKNLVIKTENFALPLKNPINELSLKEQNVLFNSVYKIIDSLSKNGIIEIQRSCFGCRFYSKKNNKHHCGFLNKNLNNAELRLDCPEFE